MNNSSLYVSITAKGSNLGRRSFRRRPEYAIQIVHMVVLLLYLSRRMNITCYSQPLSLLYTHKQENFYAYLLFALAVVRWNRVVYLWGFYDIKFKLTHYKSKLGLIPQYTFDLREFDITNLKLGSFQGVQIPKPSLIPQYTYHNMLH